MKPNNEYYPEGLSSALEATATYIFSQEQMAEKASVLYKLLDNNSQPIEHPFSLDAGDTPLKDSFVNEDYSPSLKVNGIFLDYQWHKLQWKITKPYDSYRHEGTGLLAVSSWLLCEHPEGSRFDILLQTLRSEMIEPDAPLTIVEVRNSIPIALVPRKDDASFNAFLTQKFSTNKEACYNKLDAFSPPQNELFLSTELEAMTKAFSK